MTDPNHASWSSKFSFGCTAVSVVVVTHVSLVEIRADQEMLHSTVLIGSPVALSKVLDVEAGELLTIWLPVLHLVNVHREVHLIKA